MLSDECGGETHAPVCIPEIACLQEFELKVPWHAVEGVLSHGGTVTKNVEVFVKVDFLI